MDIQQTQDQLISFMTNISFNDKSDQKRSNTLIAAQMPSQVNQQHIEQYNVLYHDRLSKLGKRIKLERKVKIEQVEERLGTINVVGIFKRIQFKRVRAFQKRFNQYYNSAERIYSEEDTLELEDQTGKIKFILAPGATMNGKPIRSTDLPYGIIIGITGENNDEKMQFHAKQITLPCLPPQKQFSFQKFSKPRKSIFISSPSVEFLEKLFQEIVLDIYEDVFNIIIMGFSQKLNSAEYLKLDNIFQYHQRNLDIYIMPDTQNGSVYPQKPLHNMLFRSSYQKIGLLSNPQVFYSNPNSSVSNSDDKNHSSSILACSGQNIKDFIKNCSFGTSDIEAMQTLLQYSHLSPSSPFSLKCQMMASDYLVIDELPHVYISGNCEQTEIKEYHGDLNKIVKLVSVKRGEMVLVNNDTYEIERLDMKFCDEETEIG